MRTRLVLGLAGLLTLAAAVVYIRTQPTVPAIGAPSIDTATSLRFIAVGRQGYGNEMSRRIATAMENVSSEAPTHAVLYLGDNFYPRGVQSVHDEQWQDKFESLYDGPHLRGMPFFAVVGNHDHNGNFDAEVEYGRRHLGSGRWQMDGLQYVKDFGKSGAHVLARIVFLDTIELRETPEPQLEFARRAFSAPGDPVWRIVAGHYAVRSLTREGFTRALTLSALLPQFQAMNVDLYVSANDRFQQILDRVGEPLHVSANGGSDKQEQGLVPEQPETDIVVSEPGFSVIEITAQRISVELRDQAGKSTHHRVRDR